jgi:hypothetical protein
MVVIGVVVGGLIGAAAGYAIGHSSSSSTATATPTPKPTPTVTPTPTPTVTATATSAPTAPTAPPLPDPPADPNRPKTTIDVTGTGNGHVPVDGSSFNPRDNWAVSYSWTCPQPPSGHAITITVAQAAPGAPVPAPFFGDGQSGATEKVIAQGSVVTLQITTAQPECRWHVVVYGQLA